MLNQEAASRNQLVVFDLDDTLVDTSDVYWRARTQFIEQLASSGYPSAQTLEIFESIDSGHIKTYGFAPERYRLSMMATYNRLLAQSGSVENPTLIKEIYRCGDLIRKTLPQVIEGARELLDYVSCRFELALLTRGDEVLQHWKLRELGLSRYFSTIKVVADKSADTFRQLICMTGHTSDQSWVIGDSVRSDINPGIGAGATCILYRYHHAYYRWQQEHGDEAIGPFYQIDNLREAIDVFDHSSSCQIKANPSKRASSISGGVY